MFRNVFEGWHLVILVLAFVVLFGYKKLPDAARSIGRSMRIFKAETQGLRGGDDDKKAAAHPPTDVPAAAPAPAPTAERADTPGV